MGPPIRSRSTSATQASRGASSRRASAATKMSIHLLTIRFIVGGLLSNAPREDLLESRCTCCPRQVLAVVCLATPPHLFPLLWGHVQQLSNGRTEFTRVFGLKYQSCAGTQRQVGSVTADSHEHWPASGEIGLSLRGDRNPEQGVVFEVDE